MTGTIIKTKLKSGRISWGYIVDAGHDENGKRRQVMRKGFATKREADDALLKVVGDRKKGVDIQKDPCSFEVFFKTWLEQHGAKKWGKMTREQNNKRAAYAIRMFGAVPLQDLTLGRLDQDFGTLFVNGGRKTKEHPEGNPLSPKTVREIAALVSQALRKAVKLKKIESNPMVGVELPTVHKEEVEIPQPDQYEQFLNRVRGTRYYAMCVFAGASGCRRGELLALRWADIDPLSGVATISKSLSQMKEGLEIKATKSEKTRFVRVDETTLHVLAEHRAQLEEEKRLFGSDYNDNDLVFPTPHGDYYMPSQVTGRISKFMQQAGVDASLHSLRHFNASMMLSNLVPLPVVSKRLGHANSDITLKIYSHAMKHDEGTGSDAWDAATKEIIARTRKQPQKKTSAKADVSFRYPASGLFVVNE
jgi:integrase